MNKVKLISCSFGGHRDIVLNNPNELKEIGVDVVIYDDKNTVSRINSLHSRMKSKIPKMLEWEKGGDYDYYIWVDSKFTLGEGIVTKLLTQIEDADICLFKHPYRNTIKDELSFMNKMMSAGDSYLIDRYTGEDINEQVDNYISDMNYKDNLLFACGCFVYSKRLVENKDYNLMKEWFYHNALYSIQDQLSLPYLLNKFNTNFKVYDFNLLNTPLMKYN